ncbi:MAG: radical SAM protein [Elusimicrobia bacterium]|nr:radical SAM protein [Elusimicrobiota bacterium]
MTATASRDNALRASVADRFAPQYDITSLLTNVNREHAEEELDASAVRELWRRHAGADRKKTCRCELSAYIHIPFCKQKCAYCCYYSVPLERPVWLGRYLDSLGAQLDYFAPAFAGRRFETLYIGGGTPSLLSPRQLRSLFAKLFRRYAFCGEGERAFEFNPFSVSAGKLALLEEFGFNRISMGVQSFRPAVLRRENRGYQTTETVARAMGLILGRGRFMLNVDLLLGLRGDGQASFLKTLDALLALKPSTVTAYPVKPTVAYLCDHYGGDMRRFEADLARRYGEVGGQAAAVARRRGYFLRPERPSLRDNDWLFRREPLRRLEYVYDDIAPQPVSIFSLGPTARSRIAGELAYYQTGTHEAAFSPEAKVWRGLRIDRRWEMRKFVLRELLDRGAVSPERFRGLFGTGLGAAFPGTSRVLRPGGGGAGWELDDRTPRQVFLAALRFLAPEELEGMSEVRFSLSSGKGSWRLSLHRLADGEPSMSRAGSLGLILKGEPAALIAPQVDGALLKFVTAAFLRAAGRARAASPVRVAPVLLAQLRSLVARLERAGRIPRGALRLTREESS